MAGLRDVSLVFALVLVVAAGFTAIRVARFVRRLRRRAGVLADAGWWANQRDRRRLWRAVHGAEQAVTAAAEAGVPTGDLAGVTRRLRATARTLDAGLAAPRRSDAVLGQVGVLVAAADEVARAATDAVAADVADQTGRLLDAARLEIAALRTRGC